MSNQNCTIQRKMNNRIVLISENCEYGNGGGMWYCGNAGVGMAGALVPRLLWLACDLFSLFDIDFACMIYVWKCIYINLKHLN